MNDRLRPFGRRIKACDFTLFVSSPLLTAEGVIRTVRVWIDLLLDRRCSAAEMLDGTMMNIRLILEC